MYKVLRLCSKVPLNKRFHLTFANQSTASTVLAAPVNFDQLIKTRRNEAARSILVQVNSDASYTELHRYCSQYGSIVSAHHYTHDEAHYIMLEFQATEEAKAAVRGSTYNDEHSSTVVRSPFLWFRAGPKQRLSQPPQQLSEPSTVTAKPLDIVDGNRSVEHSAVNEALSQAANVDDQMRILHRMTCLNDIGIRLRFMAALQIEQSLHGMFPDATAYPFGSSVNGFGRLGCDLDLILRLSSDEKKSNPNERLVFHTKENLSNGRSQTQRQMESISDMMQLFLPGVCHVRRILQARVPIIKYHHDHLDLEVDLSMSNLTGVYMSELLYMFGQLDDRVMPLIFTVRRWAQSVGLTNASPGRWISNFALTCLVIFFLQQSPAAVLPTINSLIANARRPQDVRLTEDGINCTFLRDLPAIRQHHRVADRSDVGVAQLLGQFFEFYSQMNFAERAISLNEGRTILKPDHSPVYIVNPLEVQLNVSKNISAEECERFRIEVRNAAWSLDSYPDASAGSEWGVLSIARSSPAKGTAIQQNLIKANMFFRPRMMDVSDLFESGDDKDDGDRQPKKTASTVFKNDTVRGIVEKIQRKGRADLQHMDKQMSGNGNNGSPDAGGSLPSRLRKR